MGRGKLREESRRREWRKPLFQPKWGGEKKHQSSPEVKKSLIKALKE